MMISPKRWCPALFFLLFAAILPNPPAYGAPCLSPSPTLQAGDDPFAPIVVRELTPAEQEMSARLFRSLAGDWVGRAESFFCRSAVDPEDIENDLETVQARVRVDFYGNLSLSADFYSASKRAGRQQTLSLFQSDNRIRIDHDTAAGDVELIEVSDTILSFLYRRILPTGRSGSSRREYFFTLTARGHGFTIEQRLYIQGKLSSGHLWRFQRE